MRRFLSLLILIVMFNTKDGRCDFSLQLSNVGVKKIAVSNERVMATDGNTLVLLNERGDYVTSVNLGLNNTYLLQEAVYNDGMYFLLYQHSDNGIDASLIALTEDLAVVYQKNVSHQGATFGYAMAPKTNGGVVIAGRSCNSGFFLYAVNADGSEAWKKLYREGDATSLPGAIQNIGNGYVVAYKTTNGGSYKLGMMQCDGTGSVTQSSTIVLPTDFYIKGVTSNAEGYNVLLQRPAAAANSIVTYTNLLHATQRIDFTAAEPIQFTGIVASNDGLFLSGNVLQNNNDLAFVFGRFNTSTQIFQAFATGSTGYDDARCVTTYNNEVWVGGVTTGNGQILNVDATAENAALCSFQSVDVDLQTIDCTSSAEYISATPLTSFNVASFSLAGTVLQTNVNVVCTSGVGTSTNEQSGLVVNDAFILYPNPASKQFHIQVTDPTATQLLLYNTTGICVYHQAVSAGINTVILENLPPGHYATVISDARHKRLQIKQLVLLP